MIAITKQPGEPPALLQYRKTPVATYGSFCGQPKQDVRERLVQEQGGICAYCMQRIRPTRDDMKIEHYLPQTEYPDKDLCYQNMLAVCYGNEKIADSDKTCDASKSNKTLTVNPITGYGISEIKYKDISGEIYSENVAIQHDLNDTLNLNFEWFKQSRKQALDALKKKLHSAPKPDWKSTAQKWHDTYQSGEPKRAYVGILLWYLQKRANQCVAPLEVRPFSHS